MGVTNLISADEYLRTSFDGVDREFAYGELIERPMPNSLHGEVHALVGFALVGLAKKHKLKTVLETRHALEPGLLYRIPDVALYATDAPLPRVPDFPPLLAIEISSPDDKLGDTLRKFREYLAFGVEHIWLIDPEARAFHTFDSTGLHPADELSLPAFNFTLTLADAGLAGPGVE
jgi:Uma2 family endonuclease